MKHLFFAIGWVMVTTMVVIAAFFVTLWHLSIEEGRDFIESNTWGEMDEDLRAVNIFLFFFFSAIIRLAFHIDSVSEDRAKQAEFEAKYAEVVSQPATPQKQQPLEKP